MSQFKINEIKRRNQINLIKSDMKLNLVAEILTPCPNGCSRVSIPSRACNGCLEDRLRGLMTPQEIQDHDEAWL